MRTRHMAKLVLWILLTAVLVYVAFFGLIINYNVILDGASFAKLGIDLKGGMHAILTPEEGASVEDRDLDAAIAVIESRLDGRGIYDRSVLADYSNKRVIVEIPWATGETEFNPQSITEEIGDMAELTFAAVKKDSSGYYVQDGNTLVSGKNVTDAFVSMDASNNYVVALEFNSAGREEFKKASELVVAKKSEELNILGIFLDDKLISYPTVDKVLDGTNAVIQGNFTLEEARSLANKIKSGSLPFKMVISEGELRTITPILGENALKVMMQAGFVALIVILAFLLFYYKVPGLVSCLGLITQITLLVLLMVWFEITLTLPGIAGIILTMGMGIDANIIIFERMKEEIAKGKNVASTIRDGFKNGFSAIADGNVTVIITAAILMYFGTGAIKGFAVTFLVGIVLSFLTAVWMSRSLLLSIEKVNIFKSKWWFGGKKIEEGDEQ